MPEGEARTAPGRCPEPCRALRRVLLSLFWGPDKCSFCMGRRARLQMPPSPHGQQFLPRVVSWFYFLQPGILSRTTAGISFGPTRLQCFCLNSCERLRGTGPARSRAPLHICRELLLPREPGVTREELPPPGHFLVLRDRHCPAEHLLQEG